MPAAWGSCFHRNRRTLPRERGVLPSSCDEPSISALRGRMDACVGQKDHRVDFVLGSSWFKSGPAWFWGPLCNGFSISGPLLTFKDGGKKKFKDVCNCYY